MAPRFQINRADLDLQKDEDKKQTPPTTPILPKIKIDRSTLNSSLQEEQQQLAPFNNKPMLANEDGSFSTEETITISTLDSNNNPIFVNIPTIINGQRHTPEEAETLYHQGTNKAIGVFPDLNQAVTAAKARSDAIGASIQGLKDIKKPETEFMRKGANLDLGSFKEQMDKVVGAGETALNFLTGFVAALPGTIAGTGAAYLDQFTDNATPGDTYLKVFDSITKALTFQPRTPLGQSYLNIVNEALNFSHTAESAAEKVYAITDSPMLATITHTAIEGSPVWVPFAAGKGVSMYSGKRALNDAKRKQQRLDDMLYEKAKETVGVDKDYKREFKVDNPVENIIREEPNIPPDLPGPDPIPVYEQFKRDRAETVIDQRLTIPPGEEVVHKPKYERPASPESPRGIPQEKKELGPVYDPNKAAKTSKKFDDMDAKKAEREAATRRSLWSRFQTRWVDMQFDLVRALKQTGDEAGMQAVQDIRLMAGATPKAQIKLNGVFNNVYKGMNKENIKEFDRIVHTLRTRQIMINKGEGQVKRPTYKTIQETSDYLRYTAERLGKEKFTELMDRARVYFDTSANVLRELYAEGLIDKKQFEAMKGDIYEPSVFLDHIDPAPTTGKFGPKKSDVRDSGIYELDAGSIKAMELDSRALMAQYVIRAENRIARNRALRSIARFAEVVPDNGWVRYNKTRRTDVDESGKPLYRIDEKTGDIIPETRIEKTRIGDHGPVSSRLEFFDEGLKQSLTMDAELAKQFSIRDPQISAAMANFMRLASLSFITRPLATGVNWGFAVANFPRDILHTYITNSNYSPALPRFMMQISRDLVTTVKDAALKKGLFKDYVNEGGGMSFLTGQADPLLMGRAGADFQLKHHGLRNLKEGLTRVNEFFEIWVRLAATQRGLREGKDIQTAVYEARDMLDFSQGGSFSKSIDHAIPYLNANIQAFRTAIGASKKDPIRFATVAGWLGGTAATLWLANHQINPEGWRQVSAKDRRENFIVMTPFWELDDLGNKRYIYFKLKKDNAMIPFTFLWEGVLERTIEGRVPEEDTLDLVKSSMPIGGTNQLPPSLNAALAGTQNMDLWTDQRVWMGNENVSPELRFNPPEHPNPTPQFWVNLGNDLGISPVETQRAVSKVIPRNMFTDMAGGFLADAYNSMTDREQAEITKLMLQEIPIIRKIASYTHPASREISILEQPTQETADRSLMLKRKVDKWNYDIKQGTMTQTDVKRELRELSPEDRKTAINRYKNNIELDLIFQRKMPDGMPSKNWWLRMVSNVDGKNRAQVFFETWKSATPETRSKMEGVAKRLDGFWDASFDIQLRSEIKNRGSDRNN